VGCVLPLARWWVAWLLGGGLVGSVGGCGGLVGARAYLVVGLAVLFCSGCGGLGWWWIR
jgi:hypothetical protein